MISEIARRLTPAVLSRTFGELFALFATLLLVPSLYAIGGGASRVRSALRRKSGARMVAESLG